MVPNELPVYNIFVRELEAVLKTKPKKKGISQLTELPFYIHPMKIARLLASRHSPKHLAILNPTDLEAIMDHFEFDQKERLRIKAAIMATAVERVLIDRIDAELALHAADEVFSILYHAMSRATPSPAQPASEAISVETPMSLSEIKFTPEIESEFTHVLDVLDQALELMFRCKELPKGEERTHCAQDLVSLFDRMLDLLDSIPQDQRTLERWQPWFDEARKCRADAQRWLQED